MKDSITVLMSVYNGEKYLAEAIESILRQTFTDFEFLIINDGSTDYSEQILYSYNDPRIRIVNNSKNIGLTKSLNKGLKLARGKYIARMDADDISLPKRLEKQFEFMEQHLEVGICGSWTAVFGDIEKKTFRIPTKYDDIKCSLLFQNPIPHPTAFFRKQLFDEYKLLYNEEFKRSQDYELWSRAAFVFPVTNIDEVLVLQRIHPRRVSGQHGENQQEMADKVRLRLLDKMEMEVNSEEYLVHKSISIFHFQSEEKYFNSVEKWCDKLVDSCKKTNLFSVDSVIEILLVRWYYLCMFAAKSGMWVWNRYKNFSLRRNNSQRCISRFQEIKLFIKCLFKK